MIPQGWAWLALWMQWEAAMREAWGPFELLPVSEADWLAELDE